MPLRTTRHRRGAVREVVESVLRPKLPGEQHGHRLVEGWRAAMRVAQHRGQPRAPSVACAEYLVPHGWSSWAEREAPSLGTHSPSTTRGHRSPPSPSRCGRWCPSRPARRRARAPIAADSSGNTITSMGRRTVVPIASTPVQTRAAGCLARAQAAACAPVCLATESEESSSWDLPSPRRSAGPRVGRAHPVTNRRPAGMEAILVSACFVGASVFEGETGGRDRSLQRPRSSDRTRITSRAHTRRDQGARRCDSR